MKKLCLQFWKCIIVMFQLGHDLALWVFLFATCLDSEAFAFSSKSVEILDHCTTCFVRVN